MEPTTTQPIAELQQAIDDAITRIAQNAAQETASINALIVRAKETEGMTVGTMETLDTLHGYLQDLRGAALQLENARMGGMEDYEIGKPVFISVSQNAAKAGATKSETKSAAARANGAKGGRPRKVKDE